MHESMLRFQKCGDDLRKESLLLTKADVTICKARLIEFGAA